MTKDRFDDDIFATPLHSRAAMLFSRARFRAWVDEEHDVRPTRGELRGFGRHVLTELDRVTTIATEHGDEIAKLHREVDALRAQRDEALEERDGWFDEHANVNDALDELGRERDELKRRLIQAQRERDSFREDLARARESADARGDYVLLRLRGSGRPEVVEVTTRDEHDDGSVGVAGFRIRDRG